jgi:chorismate mutase
VNVRAVRGATQLDTDTRDHMLDRVAEMVREVMTSNDLGLDDFISIIFTATSDLHAEFPAYAARQLGFSDVPLICARELEIEGSMPRVVRMMAHVETELSRQDVTHVYLHGAAALRRDLTKVRAVPDEPPHEVPGGARSARGDHDSAGTPG